MSTTDTGNNALDDDNSEDAATEGALISPGSTATGPGEAHLGSTEADVSDGSEQKQAPVEDGPAENVAS